MFFSFGTANHASSYVLGMNLILVVPKDNVCSLGEIGWNILSISKDNEEDVIRKFEKSGGKLFNPIYLPPRAGHKENYQQSRECPWSIMTAFQNLKNDFLTLPPVSQWKNDIFSCAAWNFKGTKLALCFPDSSVHFYNIKKQIWERNVLVNESVNGVHQICWKPDSRDSVALATRNGLFVWSTIGEPECESLRKISDASNFLSAQYSSNGR